jgi:glyoxylase-like metal-dependent hydrolase (beta-lactamase superfamily II)
MTGSDPRLDLLLCGNGINFQQGDLALSTMVLIRSADAAGREVRTVIDTGHVGMRRNILEALAHRRLTPADIDYVALTHVHWDHVQNVDLFPNARIVLAAAELASIQGAVARDLVTPGWTRHLFEDGRTLPVQPGDDVIPGVELIDAAGHTPGSLAFGVEIDGVRSVMTGDALPWAEVGRLQQSALVFWDLARSQKAIGRLVELADVIYPGHDRPFRLVDGEVRYLIDYDMTMFGADPSTPGLKFGAPPILTTIDLTDGEPVGPRWTKAELRP